MSPRENPAFPATPFALLLVEGGDERTICNGLLPQLGPRPAVTWAARSGGSDLVQLARLARADAGFRFASRVGVILDAEESIAEAYATLAAICEVLGATTPPTHGTFTSGQVPIGAFISPDGRSTGSLETLCRRAMADRHLASCVDALAACAGPPQTTAAKRDKAWITAYLAMLVEPRRFHQALAPPPSIDLAHPAFDELRAFLDALRA